MDKINNIKQKQRQLIQST